MATVTSRRKTAVRARVPRPVPAPIAAQAAQEAEPATIDAALLEEEPLQGPEKPEADYAVTVIEPDLPEPALDRTLVPVRRPGLVPEWVPKLQWIASGAAIFFAAVAIVVERHEARYHGAPDPDDE